MTSSSLAQYLDQKRVVRPIDWSNARPAAQAQPAARPRAVLPVAEPAPRDGGVFRRMNLAGAGEPAGYGSALDDSGDGDAGETLGGRRGAAMFRAREAAPPPPPIDLEQQLTEAYHRGVQEGLDAARNEAATQRAMERAELQKRAVVERLDFQMNEFAKLGETIAQGLSEVERRVAAAAARILQPFLSEVVTRKAIEDLAAKVGKLTTANPSPLLKISGPEALLAKLKIRLEPLAVQVNYVANSAVEITVEAQQTTIQSQLESWSEFLAKLAETR